MLAARFVKEPAWLKALIKRDEVKCPPAFTLLDFTPTRKDVGGKLSFYWLKDESDADLFASAFWLTQKDKFELLAVSEESFSALGLKIEETEGGTYHEEVNPRHFDVVIETADDAVRLAKLFYESGEPLPVTPREIKTRIANDNTRGLIDFKKLAQSRNSNGHTKICELLGDETLLLYSEK